MEEKENKEERIGSEGRQRRRKGKVGEGGGV